jgi:hypothetical protein
VDPLTISDQMIQFCDLAGVSKSRRFVNVAHLVCLYLGDMEGKEQQDFYSTASTLLQLLDNIKLLSYRWLKAHKSAGAFNYHNLWLSSLLCLGFS